MVKAVKTSSAAVIARSSPPPRLERSSTAQRRAAPYRSEPPTKNAAPRRRRIKKTSSPLSWMSLLKRSRADPARALFEPDPTTAKPKRRRAHKARDVSDDLELGPRRRHATFFEAASDAPRMGRGLSPPRAARGPLTVSHHRQRLQEDQRARRARRHSQAAGPHAPAGFGAFRRQVRRFYWREQICG